MTAKAFAQVLLRVWGVVLIVSALIWMASAVTVAYNGRAFVIPLVMRLLIELGVGLTLIRNGDRIGAWLVSDIEADGPPMNGVQAQAIGLAILGAWFLIRGLSDLLGISLVYFNPPTPDEAGFTASLREKQFRAMIIGGVQAAAGAILLLRRVDFATRISRGWRNVRGQE